MTSPSMMLTSGTMPPSGVKRVVHRVDGAARGVGRHRGEQRGVGDAEAHLFAFHVAARLQRARGLIDVRRRERVAARFGPVGARRRPARNSTAIAAKTAQPCAAIRSCARACRSARRDREDRRTSRGSSRTASGSRKDVRELALKKPPPFVPELLDRILRRDRPWAIVCSVISLVSLTGIAVRPVDDVAVRVLLIHLTSVDEVAVS